MSSPQQPATVPAGQQGQAPEQAAPERPDPLAALQALMPQEQAPEGDAGLDAGQQALAEVELIRHATALGQAYPDLSPAEVTQMQKARLAGDVPTEHRLINQAVERRIEREAKERKAKLADVEVERPGGATTAPVSTATTADRKKAALDFIKQGGAK